MAYIGEASFEVNNTLGAENFPILITIEAPGNFPAFATISNTTTGETITITCGNLSQNGTERTVFYRGDTGVLYNAAEGYPIDSWSVSGASSLVVQSGVKNNINIKIDGEGVPDGGDGSIFGLTIPNIDRNGKWGCQVESISIVWHAPMDSSDYIPRISHAHGLPYFLENNSESSQNFESVGYSSDITLKTRRRTFGGWGYLSSMVDGAPVSIFPASDYSGGLQHRPQARFADLPATLNEYTSRRIAAEYGPNAPTYTSQWLLKTGIQQGDNSVMPLEGRVEYNWSNSLTEPATVETETIPIIHNDADATVWRRTEPGEGLSFNIELQRNNSQYYPIPAGGLPCMLFSAKSELNGNNAIFKYKLMDNQEVTIDPWTGIAPIPAEPPAPDADFGLGPDFLGGIDPSDLDFSNCIL